MTVRLYVLLADTAVAEAVVARLRPLGLSDSDLHAVARYDPDHPLPEAGLLETTDVAGATGRGAAAGLATGAFAGLVGIVLAPLGLVIGGAGLAATTLAGAGFGAWAAAMIGVSESSDTVAEFEDAIAAGRVLLLIDGNAADEAAIREQIAEVAPAARVARAADSAG